MDSQWIVGVCDITFCPPTFNPTKAVCDDIIPSFLQVIGQCKVIATYLNESQDLRLNDFNCTTSSGMVICSNAN